MSRLLFTLAAVGCVLTLAGCSAATPSTPAPTAAAASEATPTNGPGATLDREGFSVTGPDGYADRTQENAATFDQDATLQAYFQDDEGSTVTVYTVKADHPELASFVKQYVADAKADGTMDVLSQKPAKVGGQDAVVLTLQDKAEGTGELQYLTARPGYVLFVAGPNSNDPSRAAIAATAEKIAFK